MATPDSLRGPTHSYVAAACHEANRGSRLSGSQAATTATINKLVRRGRDMVPPLWSGDWFRIHTGNSDVDPAKSVGASSADILRRHVAHPPLSRHIRVTPHGRAQRLLARAHP